MQADEDRKIRLKDRDDRKPHSNSALSTCTLVT